VKVATMKTELSNTEIALFALHKLGGVTQKVHTERVAWEAYKLAPDRFGWSLPEFRQRAFPDKTTVRYALESGKKINLVKGRAGKDKGGGVSEGWQFTPSGTEWMQKNLQRISIALKQHVPLSQRMQPHQAERFVKRIRSETIFKCFQKDSNLKGVSKYEFTDMLSCTPDAPVDIIKQKFDILKVTANFIEDRELQEFLSACEKKYSELLRA